MIASIFAASRMLAMLTTMDQVPHRHLGMPGTVRNHTPVSTATAIVLDAVVLAAFLWIKVSSDPLILVVAAVGIVAIVGGERWLMKSHTDDDGNMHMGHGLEHDT